MISITAALLRTKRIDHVGMSFVTTWMCVNLPFMHWIFYRLNRGV